MKLKDWASTAEIVASFAVVISLAFIILEIRGNTLAIERQASIERYERIVDPYINTTAISSIYAKIKAVDGLEPVVAAYVERYDLGVDEAVRLEMLSYRIWLGHEVDFINDGPSARLGGAIRFGLAFPDTQIFWQILKESFDPEFGAYVKSLCEMPGDLPSCSSKINVWGKDTVEQK